MPATSMVDQSSSFQIASWVSEVNDIHGLDSSGYRTDRKRESERCMSRILVGGAPPILCGFVRSLIPHDHGPPKKTLPLPSTCPAFDPNLGTKRATINLKHSKTGKKLSFQKNPLILLTVLHVFHLETMDMFYL